MTDQTKTGRPKRFAVFITNFRDHFVREFVKGVESEARLSNVCLVFAQSESRDAPLETRYQYNALFDLFKFGSIDGLILPTGIMFNFSGVSRAIEFCKTQKDLPIVSVGWPLNGYTSLYTDNESGMSEAIEHLVSVHGRRQIAFIKGRSQNYDAMERFSNFLTSLSKRGMLADPGLIVEGDFTPSSGTNAVDTLVLERKKSFDAVVASNDDMALAVIKRLGQLNIRVPEDVSVVGFDNLTLGANSLPGLASIDQQIEKQGELSVKLLLQKLNGVKPQENTVLKTRFVPRSSCGCLSSHVSQFIKSSENVNPAPQELDSSVNTDSWEEVLEDYYKDPDIIETLVPLEKLVYETLKRGDSIEKIKLQAGVAESRILERSNPGNEVIKRSREFLHLLLSASLGSTTLTNSLEKIYSETEYLSKVREMVGALGLDELKKWLIGFFGEFGIKKAFLAFFPVPIDFYMGDTLQPPDMVIPFLLYLNGEVISIDAGKTEFPLDRFIPESLIKETNCNSLICYPLFFKEQQYGYALFEKDILPVYLLNTLADQIGASYRLILINDERERVEKKLRRVLLELEESNKELFNLSKTDELTGLNNRRGFFDHAAETLELARYRKLEGNLFFIDLDGLKKINDRFGHEMGDRSISAVSEILKKIFKQDEIIARLGGDEFIILSVGTNKEYSDEISDKIRDCLSILNQTKDFPVELAMSMGCSHFSPSGDKSLATLMIEADDNLYKEKNIKKKQKLVRNGFSFRQTAL